ncbi:bifunctional UDP-N-acetylmuramoyl-tripeptide:D-alanyl-D-alanine ligase/alanine racemase [Saccharicrinis aurantiacus]|uniref:bifunctional UDP-N-acetylmuramoyl-tripeptide:D-alanyl-D-alanine ligase/alanine racemase n=1 Tax=Saccharicrinis aurantiacus TaxID=1849719 RepID=UPI000838F38C|nr:bifunctional UDP-N-acetylmuramoyl-tripeptide:D-alanyl-D-alanine ligase/alanine racemase [Saccharicrinis aurantiacus]
MESYQLLELSEWIDGKVIINNDQSIRYLSIDSRTIADAANALFIAIRGERNDGHHFIAKLYELGVRNFMVDHTFLYFHKCKEANFIIVDNCVEGLQSLARAKRLKSKCDVVAITGSNGKTVVKEWLAQMVGSSRRLVRSPKSYNSQVGVPLSVWNLTEQSQLGVFEAGISEPNEMSKLESIIQPNIGIITNIGSAHRENFESQSQKLKEKIKLFKGCSTIIYCADDALIDDEINKTYPLINKVTWGTSDNAQIKVSTKSVDDRWSFSLTYKGEEYLFDSSYTDAASKENLLNTISCLFVLGYSAEYIQSNLAKVVPVAMRMELKEGINNCILVNDSYNSDISSLSLSLDFLSQQSKGTNSSKTLILSDIYQSGLTDEEICSRINELLLKKGVSKLYAVGEALSRNATCFQMNARFYNSTDVLLSNVTQNDFNNEAILIKGSRSFEFEKITAALEQKHHETRLEINLNALVDNLNFYRSKLHKNTKVLAMVKAFSYGSGSFEIANVLEHQKIDYLGVAFVDEGVELRKAGISLPIIVMNPEEKSFSTMLHYNLEPELYSIKVVKSFVAALQSEAITEYPVHIKIDTGMNRLGFNNEDVWLLNALLKEYSFLKVQSVFSHLSGSDYEAFDDFSMHQFNLFDALVAKIEKTINRKVDKHILNSAGILRFPNHQYDMVRIGIGMYGIGPIESHKLSNVIKFRSYISQIRKVPKGQTIGYNRQGKLDYDSDIAIVPVGYADGLDRHLGNGKGAMLVNAQLAPIVGNICMDMCMLDVTGLDANEGQEVEIFGPNIRVEEIAKSLDTIPYEVFTGISRRVNRVYYYE